MLRGEENQDREPEQDRNQKQQPTDDEFQHCVVRRLLISSVHYPIETRENGSSETGLGTYPLTFDWNASAGFVCT